MKQFIRYIKRSIELGPRQTCNIAKSRMQEYLFEQVQRKEALAKRAGTNWHELKHGLGLFNFESFFSSLQKKDLTFVESLLVGQTKKEIFAKADDATNNCFALLGSGRRCFTNLPWHEDIRLVAQQKTANVDFEKIAYYKDVVIKPGTTETLAKDIKLPWELSRFQHLVYLGAAYSKTEDPRYSKAFVTHINDWIDNNPYLLGANWVCPMDVALRAVNWIVGFHFFKTAAIETTFWQRFVCSLYDHLLYLENNWEVYDARTSNHYLSDLVGYFYLCWFFANCTGMHAKVEWCCQEIVREFGKQVFDEGTDYESSTRYHALVTELFYHFYLLAPECGFVLPRSFFEKLKKMFVFLDWCRPVGGNLLQIGDNDSGKVVTGITSDLVSHLCDATFGRAEFREFGLLVLKTEHIHVSLRQYAYQEKQPTGHFHNDANSITLAVDGTDVFIDPGSYVYTPSVHWRNYFRSAAMHTTFYIEGHEPVPFDERLFALNLPSAVSNTGTMAEADGTISAYHDLYARFGLRARRTVTICSDHELSLKDSWEKLSDTPQQKNLRTCWNAILAPGIKAKKEGQLWIFWHKNRRVARVESTLPLKLASGWYSPSYGAKVPCKRLVSTGPLVFANQIIRLLLFV